VSSTIVLSEKALYFAIASLFIDVLDIPPRFQWFGQDGLVASIGRMLNMSRDLLE